MSLAPLSAAGLPVVPAGPPGFVALDEIARRADARGTLLARLAGGHGALARHLERRGIAAGRRVVRSGARVESVWRDVALRFGLALPHDAEEAARALARVAGGERALVIASLDGACPWDRAVTAALVEHESAALFVLLSSDERAEIAGVVAHDVSSRLDADELGRWWEAIADERSAHHDSDLAALEAWVERAARTAPLALGASDLGQGPRRLLARLCLARRAWPQARVSELGDAGSLAVLIGAGLVESRDGLLVPTTSECDAPEPEDNLCVARALCGCFSADAWALTRAAELYAALPSATEAEATMVRALELTDDGQSRVELWARWRAAIEGWSSDQAGPARLRGAELALSLGDVDVALEWAQRASSAEPKARGAFVLGRAALARGDLVSAHEALRRARDQAADLEQRFAAVVQIGEVHYSGGDFEAASAVASEVLQHATTPSVRLSARNLLGKVLLARGEWGLADAHFAADEHEAIAMGDLTGELRARVNRAIALLSRGSSEEAGAMLRKVLEDAERRGERRAVGFALSNLAVLAIERHQYAEAIELLERTIVTYRRLGDRLNFARDVTNLVELRLRVGLIDQAEQALRFGRHSLGPGAPASRLAELALAAAQVQLARGKTLEAEREVRAALRSASQSTDGDKLGECHRVAARIALDEGMVARADAELDRARQVAKTPFDMAEIAVLEVAAARAAGRAASELAEHAVVTARESGDEELAREAHVLSAEIALAEGDGAKAEAHIRAAIALRDEVCDKLPPTLREAYLSRPALVRLARLERLRGEEPVLTSPLSRETPSEPPRRPGPVRYIGRHPSVRALLDAVARVAKTAATVLIHGESGTGKELIAELVHTQSDRASGPLVKVNCAALVETLLLSELFGHEKGAFTGANARRRGRFERANGGTLFLDEIGDISPRTQVALLRVLEERRIERVGGSAPIQVDVRIVCATNKNLRELVERGEFREDLYYRLSGITLNVPALRERSADLPLLCEAVLERVAAERGDAVKQVAPDAIALLSRYRWPGNVRELENALRAVSVLADGAVLGAADFVEHVESLRKLSQEPVTRRDSLPPRSGAPVRVEPAEGDVTAVAYREVRDGGVSLSDLKRNIERECIARAIHEANGNITRAAALLGMKRPRLSQLVKEYGFLVKGSEDPR